MRRLVVPPDLDVQVAALIGVPFLPKGDTPAGWDCRGLTRWCLARFCGIETPDYRPLYEASIVTTACRADRARLIAEQLTAWRPVAPQAGVVALLEWMGAAGHVAFMLSPARVIHADTRCGTVELDLTAAAAAYRLRGAYLPADVETSAPGTP